MTDDPAPRSDEDLAGSIVGPVTPLNAPIVLVPADPAWPAMAEQRMRTVRAALGDRVRLLEHCGSTSVPGLAAKPVIDLVMEVADPGDEAAYVPPLESIGYALRVREPDWYAHRMLRIVRDERPVVHLHVFPAGCPETRRMLAFRDHLRADAADRARYQRTKQELARRTWRHLQHYADAKTEVVADIMTRALPRAGDQASSTERLERPKK